jgi:hypothetical protein
MTVSDFPLVKMRASPCEKLIMIAAAEARANITRTRRASRAAGPGDAPRGRSTKAASYAMLLFVAFIDAIGIDLA